MASAAIAADVVEGYGNGAYLTVSDDPLTTWEDIPGSLTASH